MAPRASRLVAAGTIRGIDVLILGEGEDGSVEAIELSDVEELGELQAIKAQLAELLAEDDVVHLAAAMKPGSTAGVMIRENLGQPPSRRRQGVREARCRERSDEDPGDHRLIEAEEEHRRPKGMKVPISQHV